MPSIKRGFFGLKMGVAFTTTWPIPDEWAPDAFVTELGWQWLVARGLERSIHPGVSPDGRAIVTLWDGEGGHRHGPRSPAGRARIRPGETYTQSTGATKRAVSMLSSTSAPVPLITCTRVFSCLHNKLIYTEPYEEWRTFPTWSPDGMRIAFASFLDFMGQFEIWAADTDGDNWVELTNGLGGREPAWQPVVPSATATSVESSVVGTDQIAAFSLIAPRA